MRRVAISIKRINADYVFQSLQNDIIIKHIYEVFKKLRMVV